MSKVLPDNSIKIAFDKKIFFTKECKYAAQIDYRNFELRIP